MLTLNSMPHGDQHLSASLIATGRENLLPPDLSAPGSTVPPESDPADYVERIVKEMQSVHRRLTPEEAPARPNPYEPGDFIWVRTSPPERTSKLAPKWTGPYAVRHILNPWQVQYELDTNLRTVHINHTKPAHVAASLPDRPAAAPAPAPPPPDVPVPTFWPGRPIPARSRPAPPPPAHLDQSRTATPPPTAESQSAASSRSSTLTALSLSTNQPPAPLPHLESGPRPARPGRTI